MTDQSFPSARFGFRVSGLMLRAGRVLLASDELANFWVLPGGSVKLYESSADALKREFLEEIGVKIELIRLLWVVENSFEFEGLREHGIGLDFLVQPVKWTRKLLQDEFGGLETDYQVPGTRYEGQEELKLIFRWFKISELDAITIKPKIYHQALRDIPDHPVLYQNLELK